jgi:hypothetical protein
LCVSLLAADKTSPKLTIPLDQSALLLRGARLRTTNWVLGLVVYTGEGTELCYSLNPLLLYLIFLAELVLTDISYWIRSYCTRSCCPAISCWARSYSTHISA